jgi:ABC-2 type transport system permease protein
MRRYWQVYRTFFVSSLVRELEFRANFVAKIFQNFTWIFFFVMILLVVYSRTDAIAGWNRGDAFVLAATCFLMNALTMAFFFSLQEIPQHVRMGTLDFVITKPIDTQFWISTRRFNFDQIGTFTAGVAMVIIGVLHSGVTTTPLQWVAYGALTIASTVIFYSFNLMLMTLGIWLVRVDNLWVLGESLMQIARYPVDIYGHAVQRVFLYVLPLAFIATVPSRQLVQGFDAQMLGLGLGWAVAFFLVARWFWRFALGHYTSASS